MNLLKNKKAQGSNYIAVIIVLFLFGAMNILAYLILTSFITQISTTGLYNGQAVVAGDGFVKGLQTYDYTIVLLAIIFVIGVGVTNFKVAANRAFFIVTVIMGLFWCFISYVFNYVFSEYVSQAVFNTVVGTFPRTILLLTNLHWLCLVMIIVGSISLYAKRERGQFQ